jgi:acetoin:2,6-dichlorophenolindophenol oxidoreductase subunit beta
MRHIMNQPNQNRRLTYAMAINEALHQSMAQNPRVILIGEGVPDPKAIFGTTRGLREKFGHQRVFDMPLSENGVTGICIGAALTGMRPVMVHQRIDFALLALDQLINNAAKWHYMFNGQACVPLVVRVIIGRGWGQGPQHSQSLQALFGHIPGLKVVMPTTAYDAKGMLISAIEDENPVIFIEHRWLHTLQDDVPEQIYRVPLDKARYLRQGNRVTLVAFSYMVIEALRVAEHLKQHGIEIEIIDMRSPNPLDMGIVIESITKTRHLMVLDTGCKTGGIGAEILAQVMEQAFNRLNAPPVRISNPDHPVPTSHFLADLYYPEAPDIASQLLKLIGFDELTIGPMIEGLARSTPLDVPDNNFNGPF